jgi:hypothetical protein
VGAKKSAMKRPSNGTWRRITTPSELDFCTPGWVGQSDKFDMDAVCGAADKALANRGNEASPANVQRRSWGRDQRAESTGAGAAALPCSLSPARPKALPVACPAVVTASPVFFAAPVTAVPVLSAAVSKPPPARSNGP